MLKKVLALLFVSTMVSACSGTQAMQSLVSNGPDSAMSWTIRDATKSRIATLTTDGRTYIQSDFANGVHDTMRLADIASGVVRLSGGRVLRFESPTHATVYSANGSIIASADTANGNLELRGASGQLLATKALPKGQDLHAMSGSCNTLKIAYAVAIAAEVAAGASLDPVALIAAAAVAEDMAAQLQEQNCL